MRPFHYRLQALLDRKAERKDEVERAPIGVRQKLRDAEAGLAAARERQQLLEAARTARRGSLLTAESDGMELRRRVGDMALLGRRIEDVKDEAMSLRLHIEECKEQVELAAAAVAAAARELEVMKKHRERSER